MLSVHYTLCHKQTKYEFKHLYECVEEICTYFLELYQSHLCVSNGLCNAMSEIHPNFFRTLTQWKRSRKLKRNYQNESVFI